MQAVCIRGDNAGPMTGAGTNTWLVLGAEPTLIDTAENTEAYAARVAEVLETHQPGATLARVLITHAHSDHISGVDAIHRRWPDAAFAKFPHPTRDAAHPVAWRALKDEDVVPAGDGVLWAIHTPGHAPDHVCYFEPRTAALFGGDLLVNGRTVTIPVSSGGDLKQYLHSLRRILELQPRRVLPAHGATIEQPASLIRGYLGQRMLREQQILDALQSGAMSADEVVGKLYQGLEGDLMGAAKETVLAHLFKLRDEGRVAPEGDESATAMATFPAPTMAQARWVITVGSVITGRQ
jgi:glyoxylase-like metal-dependent hydrolase (beta-lactamase superfamily II)